jgi:hypothetical protein
MKGGWARNDGNNSGDTSVYGITISKTRSVGKLSDLYELTYITIDPNCLYYVFEENAYYKVKDIDQHENSNGWELASNEEIERVEKIVDSNKGNNPHTGDYDAGTSYLQCFGELFKDSKFETARYDETNDAFEYGFNITMQADSTKCLFYGSGYLDSDIALRGNNRISPHNFFGGSDYDEEASLSVINSKELHIVFDDAHRDFLEKDVLPYLTQVIPSTTIFSYSFEHLDGDDDAVFEARTHQVICDGESCRIYGVI